MFNVGDRVRVKKFMGQTEYSKHVGATGTVTKVNGGNNDYTVTHAFSYHVTLDRPQVIAAQWSKQTAVDILYYPEELEYEDNRKSAITGDILGWGGGSQIINGDFVRLNNGMTNCEYHPNSKHPLAHVFRLFANYRQGDTALHVTCLGCDTIAGLHINSITPVDVDNIMYACVEPRRIYDIEPRDA